MSSSTHTRTAANLNPTANFQIVQRVWLNGSASTESGLRGLMNQAVKTFDGSSYNWRGPNSNSFASAYGALISRTPIDVGNARWNPIGWNYTPHFWSTWF